MSALLATTDSGIAVERLTAEYAAASGSHRDALRRSLIEAHLPLARSFANRYAGRGIARDDLFQVACVGLTKAANGYDPDRGSDFLGYAIPTIRGELRRHFRDAGWMVRPPRRIQELQARVWAADAELTQTLHRPPTPAELAEATGASLPDVRETLAVDGCFQPSSLDEPSISGDSVLSDRLGDEDRGLLHADDRVVLAEALRGLDEREQTIIRLRFVNGLTQREIGDQVGVTQMQVSRILARILADLREALETSD